MSAPAMILIAVFLGLLLALVKPVGLYIAQVFEGRAGWPLRAGAPLERWIYRFCGIDSEAQTGWKPYAIALLMFNLLDALAVYALQRLHSIDAPPAIQFRSMPCLFG